MSNATEVRQPLTPQNLEWFERLRTWIRASAQAAADPEVTECPFPLWDQNGWRYFLEDNPLRDAPFKPACGAAFCSAGYLAEASGADWTDTKGSMVWAEEADYEFFGHPDADTGDRKVFTPAGKRWRWSMHCAERAQRLLGITDLEAQYLFYAPTDVDVVLERLDEIELDHSAMGTPA